MRKRHPILMGQKNFFVVTVLPEWSTELVQSQHKFSCVFFTDIKEIQKFLQSIKTRKSQFNTEQK